MKKLILTAILSLTATSAFAYDPQYSMDIAICSGVLDGVKKEFTVFRGMKDKAAILYKTSGEAGLMLFTDAVAKRNGDVLEINHPKTNVTIDLASEKQDGTMSGKWENEISLTCKITYPNID